MVGQFINQASLLVSSQQESESDYFDIDRYNPQVQMGFVKHAFVLSMYFLMRCSDQ